MNLKKVTIRKVIVIAIAFAIVILLIGCKQNATSGRPVTKELPTQYTPSEIKPSLQASSANITIVPPKTFPDGTKGVCLIKIDGEIDKNTAGNLAYIHNSTSDPNCKKYLQVNSLGGDVIGAMNAGEFIRQHEMDVTVLEGDSCASSCVLLLLGGVSRTVGGKIGLHRPYSTSYSETDSQAKANYENINQLIRNYLKRMNIPEKLLDDMNSVPPSEIRWLANKSQKLTELHIEGYDPVYLERKDSVKAKELGISKEKFYKRKSRIKDICKSGGSSSLPLREMLRELDQCEDDVMAGKR